MVEPPLADIVVVFLLDTLTVKGFVAPGNYEEAVAGVVVGDH